MRKRETRYRTVISRYIYNAECGSKCLRALFLGIRTHRGQLFCVHSSFHCLAAQHKCQKKTIIKQKSKKMCENPSYWHINKCECVRTFLSIYCLFVELYTKGIGWFCAQISQIKVTLPHNTRHTARAPPKHSARFFLLRLCAASVNVSLFGIC